MHLQDQVRQHLVSKSPKREDVGASFGVHDLWREMSTFLDFPNFEQTKQTQLEGYANYPDAISMNIDVIG